MSDESEHKAAQDLEDITALQRLPAYQRYLVRRLGEERDKQSARVLDGKFTAEELLTQQRIYRVLCEVAKMIDRDAASARATLGDGP